MIHWCLFAPCTIQAHSHLLQGQGPYPQITITPKYHFSTISRASNSKNAVSHAHTTHRSPCPHALYRSIITLCRVRALPINNVHCPPKNICFFTIFRGSSAKMNKIRKTSSRMHIAHMLRWCPLASVLCAGRQSPRCRAWAQPLNNIHPRIPLFVPF